MYNVIKVSVIAIATLFITNPVITRNSIENPETQLVILISKQEKLAETIISEYKIEKKLLHSVISAVFLQATINKIDPYLLLGIIATESAFNPKAKSSSSTGLMQIHRVHGYTKEVLEDPIKSVTLGTNILMGFMKKYNGNMDLALQGYSGNAKGYSQKVKLKAYEFYYRSSNNKQE